MWKWLFSQLLDPAVGVGLSERRLWGPDATTAFESSVRASEYPAKAGSGRQPPLPPLVLRQALRRLRAHLVLQIRRAAEQLARQAERLASPAVQIEAIGVAHDLAVSEFELRVDDVVHLAAGAGERVPRF